MSRSAFLRLEWLLALALTMLSVAWAAARDLPLAASLTPSGGHVGAGMLAGAAKRLPHVQGSKSIDLVL